MPDIPPEVTVALETLKALAAAGRCREDAELYQAAARGVQKYLDVAFPGAEPAAPQQRPAR